MMDENKIVNILSEKWKSNGVNKGDLILVHSSLKKVLKKIYDDYNYKAKPKTIYDSLIKAIGSEGTLILPLFNFDFPKTNFFDIRNTPSHMGALTEIAREHPASIRTGHPIYSFSVRGKYAYKFLNIDNKSGYGSDSPFAIMHNLGGKIVSIGLSDQNSMTSYHYVEEQNKVDYRYFKQFSGEYIDAKGGSNIKTYKLFVRKTDQGIQTDVDRAMDLLWEKGLYKGEKYNEGYGMRTILFKDFFNEIDAIIKRGEAINYLYSVKK